MKVMAGLFVIAFVAMLLTPMAPDSQRMIPFMLVMWFSMAALVLLGLAYLLVGRGKDS